MLFIIAWSAALLSCGAAEGRFQVLDSTQASPEGGTIENFVILTDTRQFTLVPPANFQVKIEEAKKRIQFSLPERVAISVQITTNFPGRLPNEEILKRNVLNRYPGAAILRSTICRTADQTGWLVDVKRVFSKDISVTTRHAFSPCAEGAVEFIFSTSSEDFEGRRNLFSALLNSFQTAPLK